MNYNRNRLRAARLRAGMSMADLARLLDRTMGHARGTSRATIWWRESAGQDLPEYELRAIAAILDLTLEELCVQDD